MHLLTHKCMWYQISKRSSPPMEQLNIICKGSPPPYIISEVKELNPFTTTRLCCITRLDNATTITIFSTIYRTTPNYIVHLHIICIIKKTCPYTIKS
ncbi:hypothetical protein MtrunA17_Chr4g0023551 [Medicago truncatula]|uniref:Uncharacterized protein n=1 Tax=Medicago truncatula TaxID=3880 RepID=A0A396I9B7_MEDTR|nr:hypothetical protein MtrunA17_Chr4g0023551 [Medicago truncatula]